MEQEKQDVLHYLKNTNRPYSANDIQLNLNKGYGKTTIQKVLDQLVEISVIKEKIYGKQKIYSALQDQNEDISDMQKDLEEIESSIAEKSQYLKSVEDNLKTIEREYNEMQSMLTTEEAEQKRIDLEQEVEKLQEKLTLLAENRSHISEEDKKNILSKHECMMKEYRKRKRITMNILNAILEEYPKSKQTLFEEIGIELDDIHNAPTV